MPMMKRELVKRLEGLAKQVQETPADKSRAAEEGVNLILEYVGSKQIREAYLKIVCSA